MDERNEFNIFFKFQQEIYSMWDTLLDKSCQEFHYLINLNIYIYIFENDVQKLGKK